MTATATRTAIRPPESDEAEDVRVLSADALFDGVHELRKRLRSRDPKVAMRAMETIFGMERKMMMRHTDLTDTDFAGVIRGTVTLTNVTLPGGNVNPTFKFAMRGNELQGRLIEFDAAGNLTSGTLLLQSGLSQVVPAGIYSFGLDSDAPVGARTASGGAFAISHALAS